MQLKSWEQIDAPRWNMIVDHVIEDGYRRRRAIAAAASQPPDDVSQLQSTAMPRSQKRDGQEGGARATVVTPQRKRAAVKTSDQRFHQLVARGRHQASPRRSTHQVE
jgi:hypothetical protein